MRASCASATTCGGSSIQRPQHVGALAIFQIDLLVCTRFENT